MGLFGQILFAILNLESPGRIHRFWGKGPGGVGAFILGSMGPPQPIFDEAFLMHSSPI